jgi:chromosome partitioning protein
MYIIAIVNEKGGTGKTTTSVSLAAALGSLGQRILLVDLDGQACTSRWFGVEEDHRLADALLAGEGLEPIENIAPGVSLAPATGKVDSVARDLRPSQSAQLRKVLRQIQDRYDLIIMDCPPSLNNRLIGNALLAATHVLVPVETSIMALDGLQILLTTLEDISDAFEHQIVLAGVVACRYDSRTRLSRLVLDELRRALPNKVFNTVIRENVRMRECPASGKSILEFAPGSHAAEDYLALAKEMLDNPEAWQLPAYWEITDAEEIDDETQRCSVENLRSRAAATVRAEAAKAIQIKPFAPVEAPAQAPVQAPVQVPAAVQAPPPAEQAEPAKAAEAAEAAEAGATNAAINRWTGGPIPNRTFETHEPPVGISAAAMKPEYLPAPPPAEQAGLDSYVNRLAQAKARLSAPDIQVEAAELSTEPEPTAAAQGFVPAPVAPSPAAIGGAHNAPPPAPQEPDTQEEPEQPRTSDETFPALRALLRKMRNAPELAEVGSANGQDAADGC